MDAPYERQLFVCVFGPWCKLDGSEAVCAALKQEAKAAGLARELRVTKSGCLGQCGHGPVAVMWPENVWYAPLRAGDVPEVVRAHLIGRAPVERLRYHPAKAGGNKTAEIQAKEAASGKVAE